MRRGMWPIALVLGATALLVACGGGSSSTPSTAEPTATPGVGTSPFTISTTEPVSSAGTLTAPLSSPAGNGTLTLVGVTSQVTSGVTLTVTLQNTPLAGFPTLESEDRAAAAARRNVAASAGADSLLFFEAEFSATIVATGGTLSLNVPSGALTSGDIYYLAFFDPNAANLGWQLDWSGPASNSGTELTFALPPVTFRGLTTYGFALYGISSTATPPSPVPSLSPSPTASPGSSPSPSAAPSASPIASSSASPSPLPSPSPTASPSAAPGVLVANPTTVEIPGVGVADAQTVAVTESGYTGTFSQTNSCNAGTDIASFSATSAPGPSWNLVITGVSAGTCVATIVDTNGQSQPISITVTSSGFTIQSLKRKGP